MKKSDNTQTTRLPKRKLPRTAWKPGQTGNPNGAPKRGQTWAEIIKAVSEQTPAEVIKEVGVSELAIPFAKMPLNVKLKRLVVQRAFSQLLCDPQAGLFNAITERDEGKVKDTLDLNANTNTSVQIRIIAPEKGRHATVDQATNAGNRQAD